MVLNPSSAEEAEGIALAKGMSTKPEGQSRTWALASVLPQASSEYCPGMLFLSPRCAHLTKHAPNTVPNGHAWVLLVACLTRHFPRVRLN